MTWKGERREGLRSRLAWKKGREGIDLSPRTCRTEGVGLTSSLLVPAVLRPHRRCSGSKRELFFFFPPLDVLFLACV